MSLPHYLTLKLCILGRSFGGKRTSAKLLNEVYKNKLKVFRMEDMIKEVIDYVSPKL